MLLAQVLGQLQHQLVERDRACESLPERSQRLVGRDAVAVHEAVGPLGQPAPCRQVQQRRESGGDHRQQQQCPLATLRRATEPEDDDDVDAEDERRQPGRARRCA